MIRLIKDYVKERLDNGELGYDIANSLGVSVSMVSSYKSGSYNPSLEVAKRIYKAEGIAFHPFSEESLKLEINKDK